MKKIVLLLITLSLVSCDPKDFQKILSSGVLSDAEIASGLKQALDLGVQNSVTTLSQQDGYYASVYKILLPEEARVVTEKLSLLPGFSNLEEEIVKRINKGAEDAAKKAGPIFLDAVKGMSFSDVMNILMGEKNAATQYLHIQTYSPLYAEFKPVLITSLNKFGALDYWADAVNQYNRLPFVADINPDLADHVADKALVGLFSLIEKKEYGIRTDISQRTSALLKKVFAKQD